MALTLKIVSDSASQLKGAYKAEVTADGLALKRGSKTIEILTQGTEVVETKGSQITVTLGERTLVLQLVRFGYYQNKIAEDIAAYLRGEAAAIDESAHKLELYFYLLAVLPLGIPIITLGGAIPAGLGAGLCAANLGVAQKDDLSVPVRAGIMVGLSAVGYGILFALLSAMTS